MFVEKENFDSWYLLLKEIKKHYEVEAIVSDGQKGLIKAVKVVFGNIPHQRCITHIIRPALLKLTKNPQTEAGKELRLLVLEIGKVKTKRVVNKWKKDFLK